MKNKIYIILAILFLLATVGMLEENIAGAIFYGIISAIFFYLARNKTSSNEENNEGNSESKIRLEQEKFEESLELKKQKYDNEIRKIKMEIAYEKEIQELNNKLKSYKANPPTETEIKITINKIQEIYKEQNFTVKVIGVTKKKYVTEYEIIYSKDIAQSDIIAVSSKIVDEFEPDGVKIIRNTKNNNRIYLQIPFKYEKTLT